VSALLGLGSGRAGLVTVAETGELYVAIPLADWERVVANAREYEPCVECGAPGCVLAMGLLKIASEVES